jgi:hypothetical protein
MRHKFVQFTLVVFSLLSGHNTMLLWSKSLEILSDISMRLKKMDDWQNSH